MASLQPAITRAAMTGWRQKGSAAWSGVAALAILTMAGCGAAGAANGHGVPSALFAPAVSAIQQQEIQNVLIELQNQCLVKDGFDLPSEPAPPLSTYVSGGSTTDPLYVDINALRTSGFGVYQSVVAGNNVNPDQADTNYINSLTPAQQQKLNDDTGGTKETTVTLPDGKSISQTDGGCAGKAYTEIYGSPSKYLELYVYTQDLLQKAASQAGWSSIWTSAQKAWASCMAAHGLHYQTQEAAEADIVARYNSPGANRAQVHIFELKVGRQDAACAVSARLNAASEHAMQQAAGTFSGAEENDLLAWSELEQHAAVAAAKALGH
jgi:hypothetical protein